MSLIGSAVLILVEKVSERGFSRWISETLEKNISAIHQYCNGKKHAASRLIITFYSTYNKRQNKTQPSLYYNTIIH